jgi:hypothetical protein
VKDQPEIETFTLKIPPGLFTEQTARGLVYQTTVEQYNRIGQGRWKDGQFVRFHNTQPQKLGGWTGMEYDADPSSGNIIGIPRNLKKWSALNGQELEAFGDGYKVYVLNNYAVYDITPQRRQVTLNAAFQTTNGSQVVTVIDYNHGANTGDYVLFTGGTEVGGVQFSAATFVPESGQLTMTVGGNTSEYYGYDSYTDANGGPFGSMSSTTTSIGTITQLVFQEGLDVFTVMIDGGIAGAPAKTAFTTISVFDGSSTTTKVSSTATYSVSGSVATWTGFSGGVIPSPFHGGIFTVSFTPVVIPGTGGDATVLVAAAQNTTGGTPLTLVVTPYVMPVPRFITLTSAFDFSAINFTIVGKNQESGASWSEVLTGPAAGKTVQSTNVYATIISITPTTSLAENISVGYPFAPGEYQITAVAYSPPANVAASQALTTSTAITLTASPFVMMGGGYLSITSASDLSAVSFAIVGLDVNGNAQTETLLGPNADTITSALAYSSVTSVTPGTITGSPSASVGNFFPAGSAYTFEAAMPATSTATGGGTVIASYDINAGLDSPGFYYGWGVGPWGAGTWGTARTTSTMVQAIRLWSMDNWGENLMASPRGGSVYYWRYDLGFTTHAQNISQVIEQGTNVSDGPPTTNQRILVSADAQQLVCLGADHDGVQDPLYIITSDTADFTNFTPSSTNNVYDGRLSSGSAIMTGIRTRTSIAIFTDISAYIMTPSGDTSIYSQTQIGENTSLISANAVAENNGVLYWMGDRKFYKYDSIIQELSCDVWTHVFDNVKAAKVGYGGINMAMFDKITSWYNDQWSEVWWFYPSFTATENDSYVIYNYKENHWTYGLFDRTTGCTTSSFYGSPLAIDQNGSIWLMEDGVDQVDVNGVTTAIQPFLKSYDYQVMDGAEVAAFSRAVPDQLDQTGTMYMQIASKRYPNDAYQYSTPYAITNGTGKEDFRARGKLVSFNFYSNAVGANWRMGFWSFEVQSDGER